MPDSAGVPCSNWPAGTHTLTPLATFNGANGASPEAGLIADPSGNLYGTTYVGGANGYGTVFEVANDANHTLTTLATFNDTNGADPLAGLIADASGNLYGTTDYGGDLSAECRTRLGHCVRTLSRSRTLHAHAPRPRRHRTRGDAAGLTGGGDRQDGRLQRIRQAWPGRYRIERPMDANRRRCQRPTALPNDPEWSFAYKFGVVRKIEKAVRIIGGNYFANSTLAIAIISPS